MSKMGRDDFEALGYYGAIWHKATPVPSPEDKIMNAARDGDVQAVADLLRADSTLAQECGWADRDTALHKAAHYGHADVARLLLLHGSNPCSVNVYGNDPLATALICCDAPEASVCALVRVLLRPRAALGPIEDLAGVTAPFDYNILSDDEEERTRAEAASAWGRDYDDGGRLRSRWDYSRVAALLLRHRGGRRADTRDCTAALDAAVRDGHWMTAQVIDQWLRLHAGAGSAPPHPPAEDPYPRQETYRRCSGCLTWWLSPWDARCPACGLAARNGADAERTSGWRPWSREETALPALEAQEARLDAALWRLTEQAEQIAESQVRVAREAQTPRWRDVSRGLAEAAVTLHGLQRSHQHALWSAETPRGWNGLELAVADWDRLTYEECARRADWCATLRGQWKATQRHWEGQYQAERGDGTDGRTPEPDAIRQTRQIVYQSEQTRQALLELQASLAVGTGGRRPVQCPIEAYQARRAVIQDLGLQMKALTLAYEGIADCMRDKMGSAEEGKG